MPAPIVDQVGEFFDVLFGSIFSEPFRTRIADRLRRKAVLRQVDESADAASQSLMRFFVNEQLTPGQAEAVLSGFADLPDRLQLDDIANPNVTPESIVDGLLINLPCPETVREAGQEPVYRVSLHSIVQVLTLVGPVMAEWRKLNFSTTFELPRRIVRRLNEITVQLEAQAGVGEAAGDRFYELTYRDYLLQRFHRVEAGTVRMTTSQGVDLRELFVMPQVRPRPAPKKPADDQQGAIEALMDLARAREFFGREESDKEPGKKTKDVKKLSALEHVKRHTRSVVVGAPGSGKSTFFEWLQLATASVEETFVLGDQQAIPLLLRVRQLDPKDLPLGSALIEKATLSRDRGLLMPDGWLDRQMKGGRVLFMLDGLDETEPELRDDYVLPWLMKLITAYPKCAYLVSSRPVGYPAGTLHDLEFTECDLLDFEDPQINEYTRHWCTAVRLAQNEPEDEARREGEREGDEIVAGFKDNAYIRDLARNPLMLSAICLVNYFEGGQLPEDRAMLYRLCVEGLLHHWDQRRGIRSKFGLDEKLRICREVALAMQADDKAEYEADKVRQVFAEVLGDETRAKNLLKHIRYRTGLLIERRAGVFAFAHLTFQEYLAARAVCEGNRLGVDPEQLAREHADGRWQEVIPLFCGLSPASAARDMIERVIGQKNTLKLGAVLAEAYLSSRAELRTDAKLRKQVMERVAVAPTNLARSLLERFPEDEVAPIANAALGRTKCDDSVSECYWWVYDRGDKLDSAQLRAKLKGWQRLTPVQLTEVVHLAHKFGTSELLADFAADPAIYRAPGPAFRGGKKRRSQGESALVALSSRSRKGSADPPEVESLQLPIVRALVDTGVSENGLFYLSAYFGHAPFPRDPETWPELASLARRLAQRIKAEHGRRVGAEDAIRSLEEWAKRIEEAIATRERQQVKPKRKIAAKGKTTPAAKVTKKAPKRATAATSKVPKRKGSKKIKRKKSR